MFVCNKCEKQPYYITLPDLRNASEEFISQLTQSISTINTLRAYISPLWEATKYSCGPSELRSQFTLLTSVPIRLYSRSVSSKTNRLPLFLITGYAGAPANAMQSPKLVSCNTAVCTSTSFRPENIFSTRRTASTQSFLVSSIKISKAPGTT